MKVSKSKGERDAHLFVPCCIVHDFLGDAADIDARSTVAGTPARSMLIVHRTLFDDTHFLSIPSRSLCKACNLDGVLSLSHSTDDACYRDDAFANCCNVCGTVTDGPRVCRYSSHIQASRSSIQEPDEHSTSTEQRRFERARKEREEVA